jgi:ubiquinone/menaquinone biosynthesis C-methylase UbiE
MDTLVETRTHEAAEHPWQDRALALAFGLAEGWMHRRLGGHKRELFGGLSHTVLEVGAGTGNSFRYLRPGSHVVAVEPNVHAHERLRANALHWGVTVDVRAAVAEALPLADESVENVIATFVLCTVTNPEQALREIMRVLRPGGRFWCLEHVAAPPGTFLARIQRRVEGAWSAALGGCCVTRDTEALLRRAGFAAVDVERVTFRTLLAPVRPLLAAVARKAG